MALNKTGYEAFDGQAIALRVGLLNTAKDGSGTWYVPLVNSDGVLEMVLVAGTALIGKVGIDQATANANEVVLKAGTALIGKVGHDTTGLANGVKTITTAATDEVLAASTACKWVSVQAQTDNTGKIAVGASGVDATVATGNGILLEPGDAHTFIIDNLANIYVDATVAGEGVRYIYGT